MARLFDSVPPLVKTTVSASRPDSFGTDELADPFAGVFEAAASSAAEFMLAGGVEVGLGVANAHRLDHFRQQRRGRVVVEIDRGWWRCWHKSMISGSARVAQLAAGLVRANDWQPIARSKLRG